MRLKSCKAPGCTVRKPRDELFGPMREFCSPECGYSLQDYRQRKASERKSRDAVKIIRAQVELNKTNPKSGPKRAAIDAVNAFVKVRDHDKPCIVHGAECPYTAFDAGHFQSAGSTPELRFNTWNIHKQCSVNNRGSHKRSRYNGEGTAALYERNLVQRIGQARVDWLKGPHPAKQYREEDFKRIARIFSRRARHYKKIRGLQ